ncbi:MAG: hypothetical protein JWN33_223 [Candidatus Saccharibacteria bacterium]|nr:hypothetical protein [Candidatus Saccharibacteria bacterium]
MSDLDYDELDRAVSSVLSDAPSEPTKEEQPVVMPTTQPPTPPQVSPVSSPVAAQPSPAVRRSNGRFMDMVQPAGVRRAPLVEPRDAGSATPSSTLSGDGTYLDSASQGMRTQGRPSIDGFTSTPTAQPSPSATIQIPSEADTRIAEQLSASTGGDQPLVTPFLRDQKVDKRPLGSFASADDNSESNDVRPSLDSPERSFSDEGDRPIGKDTPLPAELQDDLLKLEAEEAPTTEIPHEPETASSPAGAPAMTSIHQQYQEKASEDAPTGAIFDTEAYHKPLAHPAKKKPGYLMILYIVGLLVVGAGAGAGVYFFILPLL